MILNIRYIIGFIFLIGFNCFSQNSKIKWGLYGKKTVEERRATFPCSDAKKVLLIAFPDPNMNVVNGDTGETFKIDSLNLIRWNIKFIKSFELPQSEKKYFATEIVELNQNQIDSLSHILLNYKFKKNKLSELILTPTSSYPKNAILFLNSNNKVFSYIELCSEGYQFCQMPEETITYFNVFSYYKESWKMIDLIRDFFKANGITQGFSEREKK
ncbi:hypothetical protein [Flavobacterium sp.]|uniref:hypothetical protein n=1 Tax=Flavobacterium sp. TaxID=239 RepID=UPI002633C0BF|nr:hypothetical protein [Flavobacterium sp.]